MSTTVSVTLDPRTEIYDLDDRTVTRIEALRQRILQAIWLIAGEWYLNTNRGLDRGLVLGHQIVAELARQTIDQVVRDEGGDEILSIESTVSIDSPNRILNYSVDVVSIWGEMTMTQTVIGNA